MAIQFTVTDVTSGITLGCSNTGTKKYKKLKNDPLPWYYPNHAMEIPFLTLHNKDLTIGFFGGSSKTI